MKLSVYLQAHTLLSAYEETIYYVMLYEQESDLLREIKLLARVVYYENWDMGQDYPTHG